MYYRTFEPTISKQATGILNDYLVHIATIGARLLPRKLESLESAAIALVTLKLRNVINAEEIVKSACQRK